MLFVAFVWLRFQKMGCCTTVARVAGPCFIAAVCFDVWFDVLKIMKLLFSKKSRNSKTSQNVVPTDRPTDSAFGSLGNKTENICNG